MILFPPPHLCALRVFNDLYVKGFIKQFRDTMAFAKVIKGDTIEAEDVDDDLPEDDDVDAVLDPPKPDASKGKLPQTAAGLKDFPLYTSGPKGALYAPAKMSKADFELFKKQLESYLLVIEATSISD